MRSAHRRAMRRLRGAVGARVVVLRRGGLWRVRREINLGDHVRVAVDVLAWASRRAEAVRLAAEGARPC